MADEFRWNRFEATINYESIVSTYLWLLGILALQTNVNDNFWTIQAMMIAFQE